MTSTEQLAKDSFDLIGAVLFFIVVIVAAAAWLERRASRRDEPEILPPPCDGRDHNQESIAEWERKRARIDRSEVETGRQM